MPRYSWGEEPRRLNEHIDNCPGAMISRLLLHEITCFWTACDSKAPRGRSPGNKSSSGASYLQLERQTHWLSARLRSRRPHELRCAFNRQGMLGHGMQLGGKTCATAGYCQDQLVRCCPRWPIGIIGDDCTTRKSYDKA